MGLGTALAIGGTASSLVGTGMSVTQAIQEKRAQEDAEKAAEQYMAEARRTLEVNYMDALSVNKEPYEREREAMLSAGAQAMEAGVEGDVRGSAATAGRVLAQQQESQGLTRDSMNKDILSLEKSAAIEETKLQAARNKLNLGEVTGAQLAAADSDKAKAAAWQNAATGFGDTLKGVIQLPGLYDGTQLS